MINELKNYITKLEALQIKKDKDDEAIQKLLITHYNLQVERLMKNIDINMDDFQYILQANNKIANTLIEKWNINKCL